MTDRPILFSGPMVRALIAGTKTQTRRDLTKVFARYPQLAGYETNGTLKPIEGRNVPCVEFVHSVLGLWDAETNPSGRSGWYVPLKAAVGDRLWVRESWKPHSTFDHLPPREIPESNVFYLADEKYSPSGSRGRPGIHMPRWASRLTLTVTDVRIERLQDISEADAIAEGWPHADTGGVGVPLRDAYPIGWYGNLWNDINGVGAWEKNPWIVAYTFTVHHCNIDAMSKEAA